MFIQINIFFKLRVLGIEPLTLHHGELPFAKVRTIIIEILGKFMDH
jgi:hypothetical protein